jgi:hypothetical protein
VAVVQDVEEVPQELLLFEAAEGGDHLNSNCREMSMLVHRA